MNLCKINFAKLSEENQKQLLENFKDTFLYSALTSQYENIRELAFLYGSNNYVSSSALNTALIYLMANSNKEELLIQILNYWKFKVKEESLEELSIRSNPAIRLAVAQNPDTPSHILNDMFKNACYYYVRCENEEEIDAETVKFYKLVREAQEEMYPSCKKFTKLSIIVRLLHIKNLHGWSNVSFNMLLQFLKELLLENSSFPSTFQDCKYIIEDLGFSYVKIHAIVSYVGVSRRI